MVQEQMSGSEGRQQVGISCPTFSVWLPMPSSPVARARKFSTVRGQTLPKRPKTTRPTFTSSLVRSMKTLWVTVGWRRPLAFLPAAAAAAAVVQPCSVSSSRSSVGFMAK